MIPWKIWYDEVNPFKIFVGEWTVAPTHGVICCVVRDTTNVWGRFVNSGSAPHHDRDPIEFYVCFPDNDEPYPTWDLAPFYDRMATVFPKLDPELYIKYGRQTSQKNWQLIMQAAAVDIAFPRGKSPRRRASDFPPVE